MIISFFAEIGGGMCFSRLFIVVVALFAVTDPIMLSRAVADDADKCGTESGDAP
jgi:hypothetical protein